MSTATLFSSSQVGGVVRLVILFMACAVVGCSASDVSPPPTMAEQYPSAWVPSTGDIYLTIKRAGAFCGEGYQKASARFPGEYLVYCRDQDAVWTAFVVWPSVNKVQGPSYLLASGVPMPEREDAAKAIDP